MNHIRSPILPALTVTSYAGLFLTVELIWLVSMMRNMILSDAVIKGYQEFQIRPPPCLLLPVTKEDGNKHDLNTCLIRVPKLDKIPPNLWNETTDKKRGERVCTIAGLPIGRVP